MIVPARAVPIGALLLAISAIIGAAVTYVGEPEVDEVLVRNAVDLRGGWFGDVMVALSDVGWARWLIPAAIVVSLWLGVRERRWRAALIVAMATPAAAVVSRVLKESFERARPAGGVDLLIDGFSMPSGHSASSAAFAVSLLVVITHPRLRRVALVVLPLFVLLVGVSRVVLGAHYPSDVLAGFCSGAGAALLVAVFLSRLPRSNVEDITS